jgi:hypothetical protein
MVFEKMRQRGVIRTSLTGPVSVLLVLLGGCFVPLKYDAPVLQQVPPGYVGEVHDDVAKLDLDELTLFIQVQAFYWDGSYLAEPLGVWIQFAPKKGPLEIDTRSVTIRSDDSEPIPTLSYLGPATTWWSPRAFAAGCGPRIYRVGISISNSGILRQSIYAGGGMQGVQKPSSRIISISDTSCFMFWFETEPRPEHVFVLSIGGVAASGVEVLIPDLRFEMGTVTTLRGVP